MTQPLRIVVLTNNAPVGRATLAALAARGVPILGVVVDAAADLQRCRRARTRIGRMAETPVAILRLLWRRYNARRFVAPHVPAGAAFSVVATRNGRAARQRIAALAPELLVLAGVGLVDPPVLAIPRLGTVNGHPGLLPWMRGNGVIPAAVPRGVAIGATCHRVDAGIDTGPVLARRLLRVDRDASIADIESGARELAVQLLVDVVAAALVTGSLPAGIAQRERFPLSSWRNAPAWEAAGPARAAELFERWLPLCAGSPTLDLPHEIPTERVPAMAISPLGARDSSSAR